MTTLDLTVPDQVQTAFVKGVGPLTVLPQDGGRCQIRAEALGVLDQLELTWQTGPATPGTGPTLAVTGDQRITVTESALDTDIRLRLEPRT